MSFVPLLAFAQNSVTVKQKGSGNSATIIQNGDTTKTDDCLERLAALNNKNAIVVKKPGEGDTLFTAKGKQYYLLSEVLNSKTKLEAHQKGKENGLYVLLADTQKTLSSLKSTQKGEGNKAAIKMNNSSANITIAQKGKNNSFVLNPCKNRESDN